MKTENYWQPSNLPNMWREWLSPLKHQEPSLIVTYPGSDIDRRAQQLFAKTEFVARELGVREIEVVVADYRTEQWSNASQLRLALQKQLDKVKLVWIFGYEAILRDGRSDLIIELQNYYRDPSCRLVLVCEANYYDTAFEDTILSLPSFEPRISLHASYRVEQLQEFVVYLAAKWEMLLDNEVCNQIIDRVGQSLRLIKSVVWYLRDKGADRLSEALESEEVLWQVKSLWKKLSENEKKVVLAHEYGLRITEDLAMAEQYLEKMGILDIPLLRRYVRKFVGNPMEVSIKQDQFLIGGKDYGTYFTQKQKIILKELLTHPDELVSREKMIEIVWENDPENGSDWALDSQINRLRQRLQQVGIGKQHLATKRGKGLVWLSQ